MNRPASIEIVEVTKGLTYVLIDGKRATDWPFGERDAGNMLSLLRAHQILPSDVIFRVIPYFVLDGFPGLRDKVITSKAGDFVDLSSIDRMWQ